MSFCLDLSCIWVYFLHILFRFMGVFLSGGTREMRCTEGVFASEPSELPLLSYYANPLNHWLIEKINHAL